MSEEKSRQIRFDWSINFGHITVLGGVILSAFSLYMAALGRINEHELRIVWLEQAAVKFTVVNQSLFDMQRDLAVVRDRLDRRNPSVP